MSLSDCTLKSVLLGGAAGVAGTFALMALMKGRKAVAPRAEIPVKRDPGEFMVHQAQRILPPAARAYVPDLAEKAAAMGTHLGYGATFGALYGVLRQQGRSVPATAVDGVALGLGAWAVAYLGWLPATGLTDPVWRHSPGQVAVSAAEHVAFGVATALGVAAAEEWL